MPDVTQYTLERSSTTINPAHAAPARQNDPSPRPARRARAGKWPKTLPPLTDEQKCISDDFMKYWHEVLPKNFGVIEKFNHGYSVKTAPANFLRTLEIGAG